MTNLLNEAPTTTLQLACPCCKKTVFWNDDFPDRPFCSDRCRLIDLGEWASERHVIAGSPLGVNTDTESDFPEEPLS